MFVRWEDCIRDHPRLRGEHLITFRISTVEAGSPRLRGEHWLTNTPLIDRIGSPPLARGTLQIIITHQIIFRITPACAGNTGHVSCKVLTPQDHPRLRGEHELFCQRDVNHPGSPPLARGTQAFDNGWWQSDGITPACAGNTAVIFLPCPEVKDHPRLRGEHSIFRAPSAQGNGSPPLARGTHTICSQEYMDYRITPACAGNTETGKPPEMFYQDHPRLRGEHRSIMP